MRRVEGRFSGGLALIVTDMSPASVANHEDLILSRLAFIGYDPLCHALARRRVKPEVFLYVVTFRLLAIYHLLCNKLSYARILIGSHS